MLPRIKSKKKQVRPLSRTCIMFLLSAMLSFIIQGFEWNICSFPGYFLLILLVDTNQLGK